MQDKLEERLTRAHYSHSAINQKPEKEKVWRTEEKQHITYRETTDNHCPLIRNERPTVDS